MDSMVTKAGSPVTLFFLLQAFNREGPEIATIPGPLNLELDQVGGEGCVVYLELNR